MQAYGHVRIVDDPAWLMEQITALTKAHEATQQVPWAVNDAPDDFIAAQLKGIVGVEIEITRIEGKWKVSQNRPEADRKGVAAGLRRYEDDASRHMVELVDTRGSGAG